MADYLQDYARRWGLPVRTGTAVRRLARGNGRFVVESPDEEFTADNVIVATGSLHAPRVPGLAAELDSSIQQLTAVDYRRPAQVAAGPVLVVGAGNSGVEIAHELAATHPVWLAGRDPGHFPFNPGGIVFWRLAHRLLTLDTPPGRRLAAAKRGRGTPVIRITDRQLRAAGVRRVPRVSGCAHGLPRLDDGWVVRPAAIVWATGFRPDFDWVDLPAFGPDGTPRHHRGVTDIAGLYFLGLPFQYGFTSGFIGGVGRDARFVVDHLARRAEPALPSGADSRR